MAYLTQRQEKKLLKHIEKWGIPFSRYKITWEDQKEAVGGQYVVGPYLYFNTEKYQARFYGFEENTGGIDNIIKRQFELRTEYARSLNKDLPHRRDATFAGGYYCPCNEPIYYSQCSEEKLEEIKQRLGTSFPIETV